MLVFVADKKEIVYQALGELRLKFGRDLDLIDKSQFAFVWVVDWPLLEYDADAKRYTAMHHPFTRPNDEDLSKLAEHPEEVYAQAYDIVLNGYEIGGGSLRIHTREVQEQMFAALGFSKEEAEEEIGFLMDAFQFGAPPHGGLAFGLDRLVAILGGQETIRDFIAFPKNNSGRDVMIDAPSTIDEAQLQELHIKLR